MDVGKGPGGGLQSTARKIFTGLASSYDRVLDYATLYQDRYWKSWIEKRLVGSEGRRVLDIGCGTLIFEERALSHTYEFFGVDLTPDMLFAGASKRLENVKLLVNADAEVLPFPDNSFDTILSCYVPKYVALERFAAEVGRVAKKDGSVLLYDFANPRGFAAPFLKLYGEAGLRVAGFLMAMARMKEAVTFQRLPVIIGETTWDVRIVGELERWGFKAVETATLTGGVVFAYWGTRKGAESQIPFR
jgi:demethylmenaquinone methyltransferase/2-methoxy-6-polyprenyl-1,4-benzoquinol methylase